MIFGKDKPIMRPCLLVLPMSDPGYIRSDNGPDFLLQQ